MASLEFYDKHNMVAYLEKSEGSKGFHQIIDFLTASHIKNALTECPNLYASPIEQFWQTAALSTTEDGVRGITTTIDRKVKVFVSEASIRRHLKLEDSKGLKTLPTAEIFEQLALMGFIQIFFNKCKRMLFPYKRTFPTPTLTQKLFSNMKRASKGYSGVHIPLFPTMLTTTKSSPFRITSSPFLSPQTHPSTSQPPSTSQSNQTTHVHSLRRDEGSLSLNELTDLYTSLSKKGRSLIEELDLDAGISLVPPHATDQGRIDDTQISDQPEEQLGVLMQLQLLQMQLEEYKVLKMFKLTPEEEENTAGVKEKVKGKAIIHESKPPKKIKKRVKVQMSIDEELAKKVFEEEQARFNVEREARFKAEQEQERIGFETALELQKQLDEREEVAAKVDQAHDIDWSDLAVLRYHTLQNRPFSVAEVRKNMCLYLKNQDEEEIVQQDDVIAEQFVKESSRIAGGRRKKSLARKRARETLSEESAKKQKLEDDTEKEELQVYLNIVLEDESLDVESLATKYPIVERETQILANDKYYYQIKRADGSVKHYKIFSAMLYDFDRQDVLELYKLVKERFQTASPKGYHLLLWGDLKTLIEPNEEDEIWRNQQE
ncbi:hypothetical protein Tco_0054099 [Tanacetum coccineum]